MGQNSTRATHFGYICLTHSQLRSSSASGASASFSTTSLSSAPGTRNFFRLQRQACSHEATSVEHRWHGFQFFLMPCLDLGRHWVNMYHPLLWVCHFGSRLSQIGRHLFGFGYIVDWSGTPVCLAPMQALWWPIVRRGCCTRRPSWTSNPACKDCWPWWWCTSPQPRGLNFAFIPWVVAGGPLQWWKGVLGAQRCVGGSSSRGSDMDQTRSPGSSRGWPGGSLGPLLCGPGLLG